MSIVVDASVLVALTSDAGPIGRWAEALLARDRLLAPDLAMVEATNILRRLELAGQLESEQASSAADDLFQLEIELLPFSPFAERIWALRCNITSYDAWYVAIAEQLGVQLATLDHKLANSPAPRCHFLLPAKDIKGPLSR